MQLATSLSSSAIAALLLLGLGGCSHQTELEPAKGANELDGNIAWVGVQGVQILAKGDDWEGDRNVLKNATPVYLVINNRGIRPLKVQYSKIVLVNPDGQSHAALSPAASAAPGSEMQQWALPEAVIQPGQNLSGYVYFQAVPASADRVMLDMELIDARSGDRFAIAKIPFETD